MKYASKRCAPSDACRSREMLQQDCTSLHRPGPNSQPDAPFAALASIGGITDMPVL
jgi:hypothetical protein